MTDDGLLMQGAKSIDRFTDYTLHIEFRTPFEPKDRGQQRGNSGVYHQGRHEVQVLDSFGLKGEDNEAGGLYGVSKPIINMCFPPLTWQTYDCDFIAARFEDGKKVSPAKLTVKLNGKVVHRNVGRHWCHPLIIDSPVCAGVDGGESPQRSGNRQDETYRRSCR